MEAVAKIITWAFILTGGAFLILFVKELGDFFEDVSPRNWGESEVMENEHKR